MNQAKSTTAAAFINRRVAGANVQGHLGKIQDKGPDFYKQFNIVISGVDNVGARRWMNAYLHSLLEYEDVEMADGDEEDAATVNPSSIIFMVDSGTEGLRGNIRVITPSVSSCIDW